MKISHKEETLHDEDEVLIKEVSKMKLLSQAITEELRPQELEVAGKEITNIYLNFSMGCDRMKYELLRVMIDELKVVEMMGCSSTKDYINNHFPSELNCKTTYNHLNVARMLNYFKQHGVNVPTSVMFSVLRYLMNSFKNYDMQLRRKYHLETFNYALSLSEVPDQAVIEESIETIESRIEHKSTLDLLLESGTRDCERLEKEYADSFEALPNYTKEILENAKDSGLLDDYLLTDMMTSTLGFHDMPYSKAVAGIKNQLETMLEILQSLEDHDVDEEEGKYYVLSHFFQCGLKLGRLNSAKDKIKKIEEKLECLFEY